MLNLGEFAQDKVRHTNALDLTIVTTNQALGISRSSCDRAAHTSITASRRAYGAGCEVVYETQTMRCLVSRRQQVGETHEPKFEADQLLLCLLIARL